jgi:hypothetical protein
MVGLIEMPMGWIKTQVPTRRIPSRLIGILVIWIWRRHQDGMFLDTFVPYWGVMGTYLWLMWMMGIPMRWTCTTTKEGYIAIQISSQTTKNFFYENPQLRTTISRKLLSSYETITFAPVQSQVLCNSQNWYNRKTFPIIISSIHHLRFPIHRKLFATNPSPQRLTESTQNSISFRYKI